MLHLIAINLRCLKWRLAWKSCQWPLAIVMATALLTSELCAQAPIPAAVPMMPLRPAQAARTTRTPLLSDLVLVKLDRHEGKLQLVMMLESFRTEKREGRVTQVEQVVRTRMVPDGQGGVKEQVYTVNVPFTAEGEVDVKIPAGRKPVTRPASEFRFLDLKGNELAVDIATEKLNSLQPAFLLDRFVGELPEIPELHRQALNENCLVIVTEESIRDQSNQPLLGEVLPAQLFERFERPGLVK